MTIIPMDCRPGCGACCIAPSISSTIPGMPEGKTQGKPAAIPCVQLDEDYRCRIFGRSDRPACCSGLQASEEMCGAEREHALQFLTRLEALTQPAN